ncbi:putative Histidine kinase [Candidatus Moduliflexus flocculans]|uniref:histidine kinase n=1 Tax=Candidatus Moduliflexus flocculans TaxID=1499966 RepID=A0A081BS98_9BACT|nr:putative Histidine kinase [Candidatus Moduliflexus flocculans]
MNNMIEILIVNNHRDQADALRALLERSGYEVCVKHDGKDALETIRRRQPTMVISAITMPEMDGYELCQRVKADDALKEIPVILLTPLSDPQDIIRGMESGANNFVVIPYEEKFLLSRIRYILANQELRKMTKSEMGMEIFFGGKKYFFTPDRIQIIDLLLSTYETAVQKNIELEKTRVNYLALLETSADAVVVVDQHQVVQFVNPAAERLFDCSAQALLNQPFAYPVQADTTTELHISHRDGSVAIAEMRVTQTDWREERAYLATLRDITQRKKAEEAVQQRNRQLSLLNHVSQMFSSSLELHTVIETVLKEVQTLLNAFSVSLWLLESDTRELVCKHAKGPGCDALIDMRLRVGQGLTGWAAQQNQTLLIADTWNDARHFKQVGQQAQETSRSMLSIPLRSKGQVIGVLNLTNPNIGHFTEQDVTLLEPIAAAAATALENARLYTEARREITRREEMEEELRQAKSVAEQANQSKSVFLASMSHELRTPLNAILGFSQLIARSKRLDPSEQEDLNIIIRSGEHLLTLINQVLDLSKIEAGRMIVNSNEVDLHRLLQDLTDLFSLRAREKGLRLIVECPPNIPHFIISDEVKLRQILINLLNNAIKFTKNGNVTLRVSQSSYQQADIEPSASQNVLQFSIQDTGPGISQAEQEKLFQQFVQTTSGQALQEGSGLGLAISRKFTDMLGGHIHVISVPGEGSTFHITIPMQICDTPPKESVTQHVVALAPGQPRYRVQIADNNTENLRLLTALLQPPGFELFVADTLDNWDIWEPDIILFDPVVIGYDAIKRIKTDPRGQRIRIAALSAIPFEEERQTALAAGCDDFLRTPFYPNDLFALLQKHLGAQYLYENASPQPPLKEEEHEMSASDEYAQEIPPELIERLKYATNLADIVMLTTAIDDIGQHDDTFASSLRVFAHDFDYARIVDALKQYDAKNKS